MIGNDIVDFQKAALESNWLREGYLDKLFCKEEKELILDSKNPHQMVWLLWTMKEAGYKIHFRQKLIRSYQPRSILCRNLIINESSVSGEIYYEGQVYPCKSILTPNFVHTAAGINHLAFRNLNIFIINANYYDLNEWNINSHYLMYNSSHQDYTIVKDKYNLPYLLNLKTDKKRPMSLSHHGTFHSLIFQSTSDFL